VSTKRGGPGGFGGTRKKTQQPKGKPQQGGELTHGARQKKSKKKQKPGRHTHPHKEKNHVMDPLPNETQDQNPKSDNVSVKKKKKHLQKKKKKKKNNGQKVTPNNMVTIHVLKKNCGPQPKRKVCVTKNILQKPTGKIGRTKTNSKKSTCRCCPPKKKG